MPKRKSPPGGGTTSNDDEDNSKNVLFSHQDDLLADIRLLLGGVLVEKNLLLTAYWEPE